MIFTITQEQERDADHSPLYTLDVDGTPVGTKGVFSSVWDRAASMICPGDTLIERHLGAPDFIFSYEQVQANIAAATVFERENND